MSLGFVNQIHLEQGAISKDKMKQDKNILKSEYVLKISCKRNIMRVSGLAVWSIRVFFLAPLTLLISFKYLQILTAQKMNFSIKDLFSKCDEIFSFMRIWLHLQKKSLMENVIFCAVIGFLQKSSRAQKTSSNGVFSKNVD